MSDEEKLSWKFFTILLAGLSGCGVFLFLSNATRDAWIVQGTIAVVKVNEWEWDLLEDDRTVVTFDTGETLTVPMTLHDIIRARVLVGTLIFYWLTIGKAQLESFFWDCDRIHCCQGILFNFT